MGVAVYFGPTADYKLTKEDPMSYNGHFSIPCRHPDAKDGVFHCVPSFFNAEHMRDSFEFILVDTKKIISQLRKDDPQLLKHAESKMSGSTAAQWLQETSSEYPRDMGHWTYDTKRGLSMSSGQAALIKVAQDLDLPCFPIAIEKSTGSQAINELRAKVGYKNGDLYQYLDFKPARNLRERNRGRDLDY